MRVRLPAAIVAATVIVTAVTAAAASAADEPSPTGSAAASATPSAGSTTPSAGSTSPSAPSSPSSSPATSPASGAQSSMSAGPKPSSSARPRAATTGGFVGGVGSCTTSKGALVAVDYGTWNGPVARGCDPAPSTGIKLLTTAGFTTTGTQHDGPRFICRIGTKLFDNGTQYPTPAQDKCVVTPPASAYWAYWVAAKGSNTWTYSSSGAYDNHPANGEAQAWTFGSTDIDGTTGRPTFTPNQVRAGLPSAKAVTPHVQRRAAPAATGDTADVARATEYLVNGKVADLDGNPVNALVDGHYYDPYGFDPHNADWGLTIDGIYALAAAGNRDADLRKMVEFLRSNGADGNGRTIDQWTGIGTDYAGGGSMGKLALAAIVTGYDPRTFGGHDLIAALDDLVCTRASTAEDDFQCAAAGNFKNSPSTFAQVLPIIAMLRAGDTAGAAKPVAYLQSLQHADGSFPSVLPGNDSETDSTGMAAMALALVPTDAARTQLALALAWLAGQQEDDGGFPGAAGDSTNSAAIVVQALRLDAQTYAAQIAKAQRFLASQQNADGGFAIGSTDPSGNPNTNTDSDLRASTQALGGVIGTPFGSLLDDLSAKQTAVDGANFLVSQLAGGDHYESSYTDSDGKVQTFADQGLTADGLFALLAAGGHADTVQAMTAYLAGQVDAYTDASGQVGGPYSGALAKLALVAEAGGGDPHAFGGTDLLQLVSSKTCTAAVAGDGSPCTAPGDFYNAYATVSQALGVLALQASPVAADHLTVTSPAVVRLHQLQCADGGFSSTLIAPGGSCTSEVDSTGYAAQALAAVEGTDTWLGAAQAYLQQAQQRTGLFAGASGVNSNSTALAAGALMSLVDALTSPTADPPQAKAITPVVAVQSALNGIRSLALAGSGARVDAAACEADVRASTQSVQAATQRSLLSLSGAAALSLPRIPVGGTDAVGSQVVALGATPLARPASCTATTAPTSPAPSGPARPTGSPAPSVPAGNGGGAGGAGSGLAYTGVAVGPQLLWALVLLGLGAVLVLAAGRRSARPGPARHRAAHR